MQTKRSYFFADALGEGVENVKQTKNTWHTAQKKIKFRLLLCRVPRKKILESRFI